MMIKLARLESCEALFISSMPFCTLAGTDYGRLLRESVSHMSVFSGEIPGRSLEEDWLQGYAQVLNVLATDIDVSKARPKKNRVAIVGYLMDRHEGDHAGNLEELRRIFNHFGLKLCSVWLSGSTYRDLEDIKDASVIYSFPYGRQAAQILGNRLGIPVIETLLPLGMGQTIEFIRKIIKCSGDRQRGMKFINEEMTLVASGLQRAVPAYFLNRQFVWIGDPYLGESVMNFVHEIGGRVRASILTAGQVHATGLLKKFSARGIEFFIEPRKKTLAGMFSRWADGEVDLAMGNTTGLSLMPKHVAMMELGFPEYLYHVFQKEPFLGFKGILGLTQRMANAVLTARR